MLGFSDVRPGQRADVGGANKGIQGDRVSVGPCRLVAFVAAAVTVGASVVAVPAGGQPGPPGSPEADRAFYVLPPGNYGGLPTTDESRDQIPL